MGTGIRKRSTDRGRTRGVVIGRRHLLGRRAIRGLVLAGVILASCAPGSYAPASARLHQEQRPSPGQPSSPGRWTLNYDETFDASSLGTRWSRYGGQPSSDPFTRWDPARVAVRDGALVLTAEPIGGRPGYWTTGGVSNWRDAQTYGRWTVRFRATRSGIQSFHFLLWPASKRWPPELDLAESWDPERKRLDGFVHWRAADGSRRQQAARVIADLTAWNTVTLTWTPTEVSLQLNGRRWASFTGSAIPHEPMWLALQTETQVCDRTRSSCTSDPYGPPRVDIDRVTVEHYRE